jgi:hypothetical protein
MAINIKNVAIIPTLPLLQEHQAKVIAPPIHIGYSSKNGKLGTVVLKMIAISRLLIQQATSKQKRTGCVCQSS